jgi:hypothetical protein
MDYTLALGFCKTTVGSNGLEQEGIPAKKIILTTDGDLIKDGLQAIDDTFLEWFVRNPSCEKVDVIYDKDAFPYGVETAKGYGWYKIIIPREEPKCTCERPGDWDCVYCVAAETKQILEEPKQETNLEDSIYQAIGLAANEQGIINQALATSKVMDILKRKNKFMKTELEEAAEKVYRFEADPMMPDKTEHQDFLRIFKKGAKWQQERMYSEEEVESLLHKFMQSQHPDWHGYSTTKWFEQFKKK